MCARHRSYRPHRDAPLKSKDEGKFFSEEAWAKVAAAAEKLLKEKGLDLMIETYATPPKLDADKVKAMSAAERTKFFKEYAQGRVKEETDKLVAALRTSKLRALDAALLAAIDIPVDADGGGAPKPRARADAH